MSDFDIELRKGFTNKIQATITQDGAPVNISNVEFELLCKRWASDANYMFTLTESTEGAFTVTSAAGGIVVIQIPSDYLSSLNVGMRFHAILKMIESDNTITPLADGIMRVV